VCSQSEQFDETADEPVPEEVDTQLQRPRRSAVVMARDRILAQAISELETEQ